MMMSVACLVVPSQWGNSQSRCSTCRIHTQLSPRWPLIYPPLAADDQKEAELNNETNYSYNNNNTNNFSKYLLSPAQLKIPPTPRTAAPPEDGGRKTDSRIGR
jgi:hypothetical protein